MENGNKLTLIDAGMGDKQSEKFFSFYKRSGDYDLVSSIKSAGFSTDDITDVLLTHLHFDHCGGASVKNNFGENEVLFKNAEYWSNQKHWDWATTPNSREKASFLHENLNPIKESGQLNFITAKTGGFNFYEEMGFEIMFVDGHTEKQMIPKLNYKNQEIVFAADLILSLIHI